MKIVEPFARILWSPNGDDLMRRVERAARTCTATQENIGESTAPNEQFIRKLIQRGHFSPLEHASLTVELITSRAVMAELTRHRMSSPLVQSQRYVSASTDEGVTFIRPWFVPEEPGNPLYELWYDACLSCEYAYKNLLYYGATKEQARSVLTNDVATTISLCANVREWRHILSLRCARPAFPPMRSLMTEVLLQFMDVCPVFFEDIAEQIRSLKGEDA